MMKDRITIALFAVVLAAVPVLSALNEGDILYYERRRRAEPAPLIENGKWNSDWAEEADAWAADRFPWRRQFLEAGSWIRDVLFSMQDEDGVYLENGYLFRMGKLDADRVAANGALLQQIADQFTGRCSFALIPRKNDYDENLHPDYTYDEVKQALLTQWHGSFTDLRGALTLSDYYRTDIHWRQECLEQAASLLLSAMGKEMTERQWTEHSFAPFYGALYAYRNTGHPDTLIYQTDSLTDAAEVYSLFSDSVQGVYDLQALSSPDAYNVFLGGPKPYLRIHNPSAPSGSCLTVFRDSFASAILPWMFADYETVHVVDLRYYSISLLPQLGLPADSDVLFLYGQEVLNTDAFRR